MDLTNNINNMEYYDNEENNNETVEICHGSNVLTKFQYAADHIFLIIALFGTVINILVIFSALKLLKRTGDTIHVFIISMTLGELLLIMFSYPSEILSRNYQFLHYVELCIFIQFSNWFGLAVSGLSLTMLNFDKLIYFRCPFSYDQFMSKWQAFFICAFIWSLCFGFVSFIWIFQMVYVSGDCMLYMNDAHIYGIFTIAFCVVPIVSALFLSIYLFRLVRKKFKGRVSSTRRSRDSFKNKLKSLVFIFSTTAWTSFSLLPYRIFNLSRIYFFNWSEFGCKEKEVMNWVAWILIYLLMSNSIINPLITALIYKPYKRELKSILKF